MANIGMLDVLNILKSKHVHILTYNSSNGFMHVRIPSQAEATMRKKNRKKNKVFLGRVIKSQNIKPSDIISIM